MRGVRAAGAGLGVVLTASAGLADPPAARLGVPYTVVARGQLPGGPPPPSGGGVLGQPRPVPGGPTPPTVTEQRGNAPPTTVMPPAATLGPAFQYGMPSTHLGVPGMVSGPPPAVGPAPVVVSPNMEPPLVGGPAVGPFGILTGAGGGFGGPQRLRLDADFLLWFVKSQSVPPLVTAAPVGRDGLLGDPTTQVLFGGTVGRTLHAGARFGGVYWLDECNRWGVDGSLFFLARRGWEERFGTDQFPVLARPVVNLNEGGVPASEIVAERGLARGSVAVTGSTHMWGADVNARRHLWGGCDWRVDGLLGFRYLNLGETLTVTEQFVREPNGTDLRGDPNILAGSVTDRIRTDNNFYGAQVGFTGEVRRGRWFVEGRVAVAFGTVFQSAEISGSQELLLANTGPQRFEGGLLALPGANIGRFSQTRFGVVPEAGFKLGCHLTDRWRATVGYNFLYLNSVLRPGDQIDPGLDLTRVPNFPIRGVPPLAGVRPVPPMRTTDVFVQGISFGLSWSF
jgi:hypothetical protein